MKFHLEKVPYMINKGGCFAPTTSMFSMTFKSCNNILFKSVNFFDWPRRIRMGRSERIKAMQILSISYTLILVELSFICLFIIPFLSSSDHKNDYVGLAFEHESESAKKLSIEHATEEEQLEWALAESMRPRLLAKRPVLAKSPLSLTTLEIDPLDRKIKGNNSWKGVKDSEDSTETFTGLREKQQKTVESKWNSEKEESGSDLSAWLSTQERENEKDDDDALMEVNAFKNIAELLMEHFTLCLLSSGKSTLISFIQ